MAFSATTEFIAVSWRALRAVHSWARGFGVLGGWHDAVRWLRGGSPAVPEGPLAGVSGGGGSRDRGAGRAGGGGGRGSGPGRTGGVREAVHACAVAFSGACGEAGGGAAADDAGFADGAARERSLYHDDLPGPGELPLGVGVAADRFGAGARGRGGVRVAE